jgi:hypothetical protein
MLPIGIPGLPVGQVHRPVNLGIGCGELAQDLTVLVVAEDAEPRRLSLDAPNLVLLAAAVRTGGPAGPFGSDEVLVRAVTDPGNADRWMDLAFLDGHQPLLIGRSGRTGDRHGGW